MCAHKAQELELYTNIMIDFLLSTGFILRLCAKHVCPQGTTKYLLPIMLLLHLIPLLFLNTFDLQSIHSIQP